MLLRKTISIQCTHIQIPQVSRTYRCVLSKPAWSWGAEMGANEHGVCIGNEAVFSKVAYESRANALTGLDIVRLGLERAKTARLAVDIIGELVETYGQGGACFDASANFDFGYDNSFLVVDSEEAWSIETCDRVWAAKRITGEKGCLIQSSISFLSRRILQHVECLFNRR